MTKLEDERRLIKLEPECFVNLRRLMKAHASMLEVYLYVEEWERKLRSLWKQTERASPKQQVNYCMLLKNIIGESE